MTAIAEALLTKMNESNLTQTYLAKKLNIHPALLCLIISGKRTPSLQVTKSIYREYPDLVDVLLK